MANVKRDTITVSTIITVLFMLKKKKAEAAEKELRMAAGVPTAVALEEGEEAAIKKLGAEELGRLDFSQQSAIFIRYPGYGVFFAPTTGTLEKQNGNITLKHY